MTKKFLPVFVLSSCLAISACGNPSSNWMPNGYFYHSQNQVTNSPKTSDWYEAAYREAPESARYALSATLRGMAKDIVASFAQSNTVYGVPVYLKSRQNLDPLNGAYDDALRTAFKDFGFILANSPDEALNLTYHATNVDDIGEHRLYRAQTTSQSLGINRSTQGYLFSLVQLDEKNKVVWQEARLQPLPQRETSYYGTRDYERPQGPYERDNIIERD